MLAMTGLCKKTEAKFKIPLEQSLQMQFNYILEGYGTLHITLSLSLKQIFPMNTSAKIDT